MGPTLLGVHPSLSLESSRELVKVPWEFFTLNRAQRCFSGWKLYYVDEMFHKSKLDHSPKVKINDV